MWVFLVCNVADESERWNQRTSEEQDGLDFM